MADLIKNSHLVIQVEFEHPINIKVSHLVVQVERSVISSVATPVILPVSGEYESTQTITITCATSGATIYYTIDGTTPDETDTEYTGPITVDTDMTIKAIAIKSGMTDSAVASETYIIADININCTTGSIVAQGINADISSTITATTGVVIISGIAADIQLIPETPPKRIFNVPAEDRIFNVPEEKRTLNVPAENRIFTVII